jgi:hypothetical protein
MPNVTLHLLLAERVREEWLARPDRAPFPVDEPEFVNAYHHGAFGPDLGYFPGGARLLSDLAHCVRSGDLTAALLKSARTPLERAYAWGWTTHVLADRLVHPLVGRGVSELVHGDPRGFVPGDSNPTAHVRIETGLDAWISNVHPDLRQVRLAPVFDDGSVRFLQQAYRSVYDVAIPEDSFLSSHLILTRRAGHALAGMALLGGDLERATGGGLLVRTLSGFVGFAGFALDRLEGGRLTLAYLNPVSPPAWLRVEVASVVESFPRLLSQVEADPARHLPNVNLDSGEPDEASNGHGNRLRALEALEAIRAAGTTEVPLAS